ncbi:hypothetical protein AB4Z09_26555 [Rhodococcus sp. TAF43]|uniref:hypothetical protein n=1 Tax=Rhodococcus sp. TAF43 TaxID=3237483 RepID=UPI003F981426
MTDMKTSCLARLTFHCHLPTLTSEGLGMGPLVCVGMKKFPLVLPHDEHEGQRGR